MKIRSTRIAPRRLVLLAAAACLVCALFALWHFRGGESSFSQEQYDEGFVMAMCLCAMSEDAFVDFKREFRSMQKGFDHGRSTFFQIVSSRERDRIPTAGADRLREVIPLIKKSELLDDSKREAILEKLEATLQKWRLSGDE